MVVLNVPEDVLQQSLTESLFNTFVCDFLRGDSFLLTALRCFIIGRLLIGVFTGIACALLPLFVQQIAPKQIKVSSAYNISFWRSLERLCTLSVSCIGSAVAAVLSLDFLLGGQNAWGWLLFAPAILGAAQIVANSYIPETPNYYLQNGFYIQAIDSINFHYSLGSFIKSIIMQIYYDIIYDDDDEAIQEYWDMVPEMPNQMGFMEASMSSNIRKGVLLGTVVSASQVFSGSVASISYSTSMFEAVSFTKVLIPFLPALGAVFSIILTVPALQLVETTSRRSLLLSTLTLCLAADCLLLIFSLLSMEGWWASWLYLVAFFIYGVGYNLGVGPVAYFIPAELVPAEAAGVSLGVAVAVNWICSMISTLIYYPLNENVGGWSYLFFIIPTSLFLLILYLFLPETRFHYRADPTESRLLVDLGPPNPYGTFLDESDDLF
ncbi:putative ATP synthase F0, A subunit [Ostertagia ostertagi]